MAENGVEPLSERELELVQLLSRGLTNREIAAEMCISPNTVKVHLRNIFAKLNVSSRTEATMVVLRMGWVELERPEAEGEPVLVPPGEAQGTLAAGQPQAAPSVAEEPTARRRLTRPPLALWQRIYLISCVLLVGAGLWLIWPSRAERTGPFSDRPLQVANWNPRQVSRWTALAQMPTPRARLAVVTYNGQIYAIAGETVAGITGAVEIYMPDTDDWARGAEKPVPVANAGAVVLDGRIYVPGGSAGSGQISDLLEILDPREGESGTWTNGKPMPIGLSAYAIAAYEGDLYLFGGWDGDSYVATSFRYSAQADEWVSLESMPAPRAFAGAGTIGDRIYVVGGYDGQTELVTCEAYDPKENTWETCPSMNAPRGGLGTAVIADTLYVVGGGWEGYLVENEYFSPAQGVWKTFPSPVLEEWRNLGVASNETFLYAIGGWSRDEYLAANQAYRALFRLFMPSATGLGSGG